MYVSYTVARQMVAIRSMPFIQQMQQPYQLIPPYLNLVSGNFDVARALIVSSCARSTVYSSTYVHV